MSSIVLSSNVSGTAVFTLASPATSTNQTLTIPDATGTVLAIDSAGAINNSSGVMNFGAGQVYKDASGNVGIGTSSPLSQSRLTIAQDGAVTAGGLTIDQANGLSNRAGGLFLSRNGDNRASIEADFFDGIKFSNKNGAGALTERLRIDSAGNLLVGTTTTNRFLNGTFVQPVSTETNLSVCSSSAVNYDMVQFTRTGTGNAIMLGFFYNTSRTGDISISGGTSTSYNTSSDYRLKDTITPMTGALAKVALLKPCTYKWKVDGSDGQGFIAHELDEVVPGCVTGEKDAIDKDGKPQYQGIDTSFLVATLTAAIQELKALVDTQAARITALETK